MTPRDFRAWRDRMGYSLTGAAKALGLSRRMIMLYEKGERPVPGNPASVTEITIPRTVALACAALESGLPAIGDRQKTP